MSFPGRTGSVIYLNSYLSTMFQVSDIMVDKDEVAMALNIKLQLSKDAGADDTGLDNSRVCVSDQLISVSKPQIEHIVEKVAQVLEAQGIPCFRCPKSTIKLYPLFDGCMETVKEDDGSPGVIKTGMVLQCGNDHPVYRFELTMTPTQADV